MTLWLEVHRDAGEVVPQPVSRKLDSRAARLLSLGQAWRLERSTVSTG
jgi:hypothetical protein